MKKFSPDTKTISLAGVFVAFLLATALKIICLTRALGPNTNAFYSNFFAVSVQLVAFLAPTIACAVLIGQKEKRHPLAVFNLRLSPLFALLATGFGVCLFVFNFSANIAWDNVLGLIGWRDFPTATTLSQDLGPVLLSVLTTAVLPALCEEGVMRGALSTGINHLQKRTQLVLAGLLFALMHQNFGSFGPTFLGGMWLYWLYLATGSLTAPVIAHFVSNLGVVLCETFGVVNALHALIATPLGAGVAIAATFLAGAGMVGIARLGEKRLSLPAVAPICNQNKPLAVALFVGTIIVGVGATAISFAMGVLA